MQLDYQEIYNALSAIVPAGTVFELRLLGARKGKIDSGYFDDPAHAANAICALNDHYLGMYFTPNPVSADVVARSYNRITPYAQYTTGDGEIVRRRWLLIDIDPKRPKGISSTDTEHAAAIAKGKAIAATLSLCYGWCDPMLNSSGNGCHLMYPMEEENTDEVRDEVHTFLKTLKVMFDDAACDIDITVYNAARIWRVPGTWARKGDSIAQRPHRRAKILQPIQHLKRIGILQLLRFNQTNADKLGARLANAPTGVSKSRSEYPADEAKWKRLNDHAYTRLSEWVSKVFDGAREYKKGYRVSSDELGTGYEEDLTIHPMPLGIKYFGVSDQGDKTEGRRTPIALIAEFTTGGDKAAAAETLAKYLDFPITEFALAPLPAPHGALVAGHGSMEALLGAKQKFDFSNIRNMHDLQKREFRDIKWIIPNVLPTGSIMLASRPKMRKTWLALQLSIAIATGGKFLDWQCNKGDVLFLGLEDNDRRLQYRIRTLRKFDMIDRDLTGFRYWTGGMDYDHAGNLKVMNEAEHAATLAAFPKGEAGVEALDQFLDQYPKTTTIVIDTLAHFRESSTNRDIYQRDYDAMMPITKLASRRGVLVIPVTHEKKGLASTTSGDFLEDVTGSAGITGGCDGVMSIKGRRGVQEENESRSLMLSGRDIPLDYNIDMSFDTDRGGWCVAAKQDTKVGILTFLGRHPYLNQVDLAALLPNVSKARMVRCLMEMKLEGTIQQGKFGYSLNRQ